MRAALAVASFTIAATACTSCTASPAERAHEQTAPAAERSPRASSPQPLPASPTAPASVPCPRGVQRWVDGEEHNIAAEVFVPPLTVPPPRDHRNKILWRATQDGPGDLLISASLNGTDVKVKRRVDGGPGPSIINVPRAGCWTFSLRWPGNHDVIAIRYARGS